MLLDLLNTLLIHRRTVATVALAVAVALLGYGLTPDREES